MWSQELVPRDALLLALDSAGNSAMALLAHARIVTAQHVARGNPVFLAPRTGERIQLALETPSPERDIAYSDLRAMTAGFEKIALPKLDQKLKIVGMHGQAHHLFEILSRVISILPNGRIIVERLSGAEAQVGMSGSPAITENNELVGILVEGVRGTDGQQLYLETFVGLPIQPSLPNKTR